MSDPNTEEGFAAMWGHVSAGLSNASLRLMTLEDVRQLLHEAYTVGWIDAELHCLEHGIGDVDGIRLTLGLNP